MYSYLWCPSYWGISAFIISYGKQWHDHRVSVSIYLVSLFIYIFMFLSRKALGGIQLEVPHPLTLNLQSTWAPIYGSLMVQFRSFHHGQILIQTETDSLMPTGGQLPIGFHWGPFKIHVQLLFTADDSMITTIGPKNVFTLEIYIWWAL